MVGEVVSHYRVVGKLGGGGMGVVYEAEDTRLHRRVALKFLSDDSSPHDTALQRFRREAEAASALNHPHICTIYDIGEHAGRPFIAMEKLDGQTLTHLIGAAPLPVDRVLALGAEIADALAAAHAAGIVHRDVKPANIFVTARGDAKLLDFGLARLEAGLDAPSPESETIAGPEQLTTAGTTLGTIAYMSPEQLRGEAVDARSDIFAFGAVLYEMATGRPAFRAATPALTTDAILNRPVRPPSQENPAVPAALERLILGSLEKDRELRVQSAAQLRADLLRLRRDGSAAMVTAARPARYWPAALVTALLVAAAAGFWFVMPRRTTPASAQPKRLAVLPFENLGAPGDNYFADGMTDEVRGKLAGVHGLEVIARASSDQYKGTKKTPPEIARELGAPYLLTGRIRWQKTAQASRIRLSPELVAISDSRAPVTRWQNDYDADLADVFDVQARIATQVAQALQVALGTADAKRLEQRPTANLSAYDAYLKGVETFSRGFNAAIDREAAGRFQDAVGLDPNFAIAWAYLSLSQSMRYSWGESTADVGESARLGAEKALALSPDLPKAYMARGVYERVVTKDRARAIEVLRRGLEIAPDNVDVLRNLGYAELELGRREEALVALRRAADLDPRSWQNQLALAETLLGLHRPRESRDAAERGLALNPGNLNLFEDKVLAYIGEGDLARARATLSAPPKEIDETTMLADFASYCTAWVLDDRQRDLVLHLTPAAFDGQRSDWAMTLADAYWVNGNVDSARDYAEQAETAYRERIGRVPAEAMPHIERAYALAMLGRSAEMAAEAARALELATDFDVRGRVLRWLSRIYVVGGDEERAIGATEQVLEAQTFITPEWLRIDPHYARIRGNPRFQKLTMRR